MAQEKKIKQSELSGANKTKKILTFESQIKLAKVSYKIN
jgi:hypothetical protein